MSQIDRMLLDTAGINISKAADILSRSRQTISRGIANEALRYFRPHEIYMLMQHVEAENKSILPIVKKFIEEHYEHSINFVSTASGGSGLVNFMLFDEIWIFMPELRDLKIEFPQIYEQLRTNLLSLKKKTLNIVLKDDGAIEEFEEELVTSDREYNFCTYPSLSVKLLPNYVFV